MGEGLRGFVSVERFREIGNYAYKYFKKFFKNC